MNDELVKILRTRQAADVAAVLQRLRAGDDVENIVKLVHDGDLLLQCFLSPETHFRYVFPYLPTMPEFLYGPHNPYLDSTLYHQTIGNSTTSSPPNSAAISYQKVYDVPYHATTLVEPRLEHVKAARWTRVTSSDELVRALLAIYFQCEFPYDGFFHVDHFLDDLVAGKERYCSSLLVNAVLASACVSFARKTAS